jgi:hypothetical protein
MDIILVVNRVREYTTILQFQVDYTSVFEYSAAFLYSFLLLLSYLYFVIGEHVLTKGRSWI